MSTLRPGPAITFRSCLPLLLAAALPAVAGCKRPPGGGAGAAGAGDPKTEDEKTFYALGTQMGHNIDVFALQPAELAMVMTGITDAVNKKKPRIDADSYRSKVFEMARKRQDVAAEAQSGPEKAKGKVFAANAAKEPGAEVLASGVVFKSVRPGEGAIPASTDRVKVNYEGKLIDGKVFDSSYKRNQPAEFALNGVIKCWTEGLQKMKVGGKAQLVCPADIAYGNRGQPPTIPPGATLIFDVELLEIVK